MTLPRASVVIRARDEAGAIGRTLELLERQTVGRGALELIVVDSGSADDTVRIAREAGAHVVELPPERFTYGHALNVGCREAHSDVLVSLSAHAFPTDPRWLERLVAMLSKERVACAYGDRHGPGFAPLEHGWLQDIDAARRDPFWGYSNSAGGFRAALWRERPFREDMPGTEDREWAWHWMERGWLVAIDPALAVEHDHSAEGLAASYRRYRRELEGYGLFLDLPPQGLRDVAREWWREQGYHRSRLRARLDPRRAARLAGAYSGRRRARARR